MTDTVGAVIVAAGSGTRMAGADKLFTEVAGRPLLAHAIAAFEECAAIDRIVLVLSELEPRTRPRARRTIRLRESRRCRPRRRAAAGLRSPRPRSARRVRLRRGPRRRPAAGHARTHRARHRGRARDGRRRTRRPTRRTVKEVGEDGIVLRTLDRSRLCARVQTPQVFRYKLLLRAHREITADVTDDAAMVEALGERVRVFEGDRRNMKVTTTEDLALVGALCASRDRMAKAGT